VKLREELLGALDPLRVERNAIDRTYDPALGLIMVADTFRAAQRVDLVDLRPHADRRVRTFGLAHITVDALIRNQ